MSSRSRNVWPPRSRRSGFARLIAVCGIIGLLLATVVGTAAATIAARGAVTVDPVIALKES
jgi:hypothetical protein